MTQEDKQLEIWKPTKEQINSLKRIIDLYPYANRVDVDNCRAILKEIEKL